jgi:hypothetical protein
VQLQEVPIFYHIFADSKKIIITIIITKTAAAEAYIINNRMHNTATEHSHVA